MTSTPTVGTAPSRISVARQAGAFGAIVTGVDLAQPVDDGTFTAIHDAFLENLVICIRGQAHLSPDDQLDVRDALGGDQHPSLRALDRRLRRASCASTIANPVTTTWHADTTHAAEPPALTLLLARQLPPYGGDTMFANQYLAYENLSPGLRATLDAPARRPSWHRARGGSRARPRSRHHHPSGRAHAPGDRDAGRCSSTATTSSNLDGWTEAESAPLLEYLYAQACRPEYTWRHRWQLGDMIIWDNRCTQHAVIDDSARPGAHVPPRHHRGRRPRLRSRPV